MVEQSTQLKTSDSLAQLCCVCNVSFICTGKGAHMLQQAKHLGSGFTSLALLQLASPLQAQLLLAQETTSMWRLRCCKQNNAVASAGVKQGALCSPCSLDRCRQLSLPPGYHEPHLWVSQSAS